MKHLLSRRYKQSLALISSCAVLISAPANSTGLTLPEQATDDMGLASAGRSALAMDAATVMNNPAGMTRLKGDHLSGGFLGAVVKTKFAPESSSFGGGNGGDAGGFVPAGNVSYAKSVSDKFKLGAGFITYNGLGLEYDDDWAGRYYTTETELVTAGLNLSAAYKVNDWLSLGAGFNAVYGELTQKLAIRNLGTGQEDGLLDFQSDDTSYGFNVGALFEASRRTRFGLTYQSEVKFDFEDRTNLSGIEEPLASLLQASGLLDANIDIEMALPQTVRAGMFHEFNRHIALTASVKWQEWSEFSQSAIGAPDPSTGELTADRNFDDTIGYAAGTMIRLNPRWQLRFGLAYDNSPVETEYRTPEIPLARQIRYAVGARHRISSSLDIGFAYTFVDAGTARIGQPLRNNLVRGELVGEYQTNEMHLFNVHLNYKL